VPYIVNYNTLKTEKINRPKIKIVNKGPKTSRFYSDVHFYEKWPEPKAILRSISSLGIFIN